MTIFFNDKVTNIRQQIINEKQTLQDCCLHLEPHSSTAASIISSFNPINMEQLKKIIFGFSNKNSKLDPIPVYLPTKRMFR